MNTFTIDAANMPIGRVASQAAKMLMGKTLPNYARNEIAQVKVHVVNAGKLKTTAKKLRQTKFTRYSGFPGGLRTESLAQRIDRAGHEEALRKAVYGMLPINKLRTKIMKNITITA